MQITFSALLMTLLADAAGLPHPDRDTRRTRHGTGDWDFLVGAVRDDLARRSIAPFPLGYYQYLPASRQEALLFPPGEENGASGLHLVPDPRHPPATAWSLLQRMATAEVQSGDIAQRPRGHEGLTRRSSTGTASSIVADRAALAMVGQCSLPVLLAPQ